MEYRQLGNSGVRVSVVGLGANRFGSPEVPQAEVNKIIDAAARHRHQFHRHRQCLQ